MLLLIDNYDSFTYNLYQYLSELGEEVKVFRNDAFSLDGLKKLKPSGIVISPGPGLPSKAGLTEKVIEEFHESLPVLGVCLGHQAIAEVFGGRISKARLLMHGKCGDIFHNGERVFSGIPSPFTATRYHSLIVERKGLPPCFEITAWSREEEIMGIRHKNRPLFGVQFHPESIMTLEGKKLLSNFLKEIKGGY
jgi:anthranilate synthase/aminodeoxychorismate synthase-like glutamine amidotransferase